MYGYKILAQYTFMEFPDFYFRDFRWGGHENDKKMTKKKNLNYAEIKLWY